MLKHLNSLNVNLTVPKKRKSTICVLSNHVSVSCHVTDSTHVIGQQLRVTVIVA